VIFESFDVEEYRNLENEIQVRGHSSCESMHNLYIAEIYRPGAVFLPLIVRVYLRSRLHNELSSVVGDI